MDFGAASLVVLFAGIFLPLGTTTSIVTGVVVGIVVAIASYLRTTGATSDQTDRSSSS